MNIIYEYAFTVVFMSLKILMYFTNKQNTLVKIYKSILYRYEIVYNCGFHEHNVQRKKENILHKILCIVIVTLFMHIMFLCAF